MANQWSTKINEGGWSFDPIVARKTVNIDINYIASIDYKTISDLVQDISTHPTIGSINHYRGFAKLSGLVGTCVNAMAAISSVKRGFDKDGSMMILLTQFMLAKYPTATIPDIKMVLINNAGSDLYERFDANVVLGWLGDHMDQRLEVSSFMRKVSREEMRQVERKPPPPEIQEKIRAMEKKRTNELIKRQNARGIQFRGLKQYAEYAGVEISEIHKEIDEYIEQKWTEEIDDNGIKTTLEKLYQSSGLTKHAFKSITISKYLMERSAETRKSN